MAAAVFILCALASAACALLLARGYRESRTPLLAWASASFLMLAVNNALLVLDRVILVERDLHIWRDGSGFAGPAILLVGLIVRAGVK